MIAEHADVLSRGVAAWNHWRQENPNVSPDLSGVIAAEILPLERLGVDLSGADFRSCNLEGADFYRTWLVEADFSGARATDAVFGGTTAGRTKWVGASLERAHFMQAVLFGADFTGAILTGSNFVAANLERAVLSGHRDLADVSLRYACLTDSDLSSSDLSGLDLQGATLIRTNLRGSSLRGADLRYTQLVETVIEDAEFDSALVYGASIWNVGGVPRTQRNLVISEDGTQAVSVDDLEVAQFVHLLLRREKIRQVLTTITSKAVLILGRFTPERKAVLDAIAVEIRKEGLLPIMFDFDRATTRDFTETIKVLAGLSLFVVADITNPSSAPLELQATVPDYQIPFVPLIKVGEKPFAMFQDLWIKYRAWMLDPVDYPSVAEIPLIFRRAILQRALQRHAELQHEKARELEVRSWTDYVDPPAAASQ